MQVDAMCGITVGRVLRDRYVLEERLGSSGRGSTFKARDRLRSMLPDSHQYVALKIVSAGDTSSEQRLTSLRREFYRGQGLSNGNVVKVYDMDCDGDVLFFTMEMLEGESLGKVIARLRPAALRRPQAWQLIRQLGAGLAHAHERGVVHGDLTPKNIFVTREGEVRILNFRAPHTFTAPTPGTPAYASCEQLEGRQPEPSDDLYALACISYELLTGIHPFGSRAATLARDYRVSAVRPQSLSGRQWRVLQRGLAWHRAGRSISVPVWLHRLISDRERESHAVTPLPELTRAAVSQSNLPWRAAAVFFLTASLATAAFLTQSGSTSSLAAAKSAVVGAAPTEYPDVAALSGLSPRVSEPSKDMAAGQAAVTDKNAVVSAPLSEAPRPTSLVLAVEPSRVEWDDHFAEIRLHRSQLHKTGSFSWWTEPGTAKAGVDYLPETATNQAFPTGYSSTRVYVKLLPQALRSHRSYFYVAISEPGQHGRRLVTRRQIWLPVASNLQARR